jgi:16S rRNA processing protein RimM
VDLTVGRIGRPHGIRGDVTIEVRTDDPDQRFALGQTLRTEPVGAGPLVVEWAHWHSGRLLLRFAGCASREDAEALRGVLLVVETSELPALSDPDEFYDHQLVGLSARSPAGVAIGEVTEVVHSPAGELLAIAREDGEGELLVPFIRQMVPEIRPERGYLVVDPPEGLLELES